ncbi:MAG: OsmC family protein [Chloroflexi bacterium]|nr:MAG: OsmC family protein [Chloroflexota bacterium]
MTAEVSVRCRWTMSEEPPWRVTSVVLTVEAPPGLSPERMASLARAASHCTVHNSLADPPDVSLAVMPAMPIAVEPGASVG